MPDVDALGHLRRVRHEEVHERGVLQLAVLVVHQTFVHRAGDSLRDAAMNLPFDDHRVDHRPAVAGDRVVENAHLGRPRVGFDDHGVDAVGEGAPDGRVVVGGLQSRLLAFGDGRLIE